MLRPEDDGRFVALDVRTGEHEVDEDDYTAVSRLRARNPTAEAWLGRVGQPLPIAVVPGGAVEITPLP
jgi:hypothetical protein